MSGGREAVRELRTNATEGTNTTGRIATGSGMSRNAARGSTVTIVNEMTGGEGIGMEVGETTSCDGIATGKRRRPAPRDLRMKS